MNFKLLNARKEYHMNEYLENQLNKSVVYQQLKDNCERNNQHEVLALVIKEIEDKIIQLKNSL